MQAAGAPADRGQGCVREPPPRVSRVTRSEGRHHRGEFFKDANPGPPGLASLKHSPPSTRPGCPGDGAAFSGIGRLILVGTHHRTMKPLRGVIVAPGGGRPGLRAPSQGRQPGAPGVGVLGGLEKRIEPCAQAGGGGPARAARAGFFSNRVGTVGWENVVWCWPYRPAVFVRTAAFAGAWVARPRVLRVAKPGSFLQERDG